MFILASASPRRVELLKKIVSEFKTIPSTVDEDSLITKDIPSMELPEFLAVQKALDVFNNNPNDIVLGADTAIVCDNKIYGKPKDAIDAKKMLTLFSNKTHYVVTGVCLVSSKKTISFSSINEVTFYNLSEQDIDEYLMCNEYFDKAGSYAIQGKGELLIKSIKGDYNSIVGLPVSEINRILKNYF